MGSGLLNDRALACSCRDVSRVAEPREEEKERGWVGRREGEKRERGGVGKEVGRGEKG